MIITVTEDQKRVIESQGYMVIQYKKWCYDTLPPLENYIYKIHDTVLNFFQKMIFFVRDMMNRAIIPTLKSLEQKIIEFADAVKELIPCGNYMFEERPRYKFIRSLGRDYINHKGNKVIYHRCRDRC